MLSPAPSVMECSYVSYDCGARSCGDTGGNAKEWEKESAETVLPHCLPASRACAHHVAPHARSHAASGCERRSRFTRSKLWRDAPRSLRILLHILGSVACFGKLQCGRHCKGLLRARPAKISQLWQQKRASSFVAELVKKLARRELNEGRRQVHDGVDENVFT